MIIITILIILALLALIYFKLHSDLTKIKSENKQDIQNLFTQLEAYSYIKDRLNLNHGIPFTTNWSASPDFLKIVCNHILESKPAFILECSSGTSTLIAASACKMNDKGKVVSLEHEEKYSEISQNHISRYDLGDFSQVIYAPLKEYEIHQNTYKWYDTSEIPDNSIDLLIIDGPPGYLQKNSRYPALPLLFDKLSNHCVVLLDDAARADEHETVQAWLDETREMKHEYISTERGCSILKLTKED